MSKTNTGDNFRTTHKLKINVSESSPFPGFAAFSLGGVAGFFSVPQSDMSVDVIFGDIQKGEHITDTVEWFYEMAREVNAIGLRVIGCKDRDLRAYLIQKFGFVAGRGDALMKSTISETRN